MKSLYRLPALTAGALVFGVPSLASACAVCGLDGDPGYFWSLIFLTGMPFAVTAAVGGVLVISSRRGRSPGRGRSAQTKERAT
ncbi:MAG: hypothetical protein AABZ64_12645 [Nitrospinota bacterium]